MASTRSLTDANAALVVGAPRLSEPPPLYSSESTRLPFLAGDARSPVVCAAYRVACIPGTNPPRATLSLATEANLPAHAGTLGVGSPASGGEGSRSAEHESSGRAGWRLGPLDFCTAREHATIGVPARRHCFCPTTYALGPRFVDPMGYGRWVPAMGLPRVPALNTSLVCAERSSYVTYQCSRVLLLPPPPERSSSLWPRRSPPRGARASRTVDVLVSTSDHHGHGLFALVQRVLNQVVLAQKLGLEPYVFLGRHTFVEPQACEYGMQPYFDQERGDNVWEYFFRQPADYRPGATYVRNRRVASLQVTAVEITSRTSPLRVFGDTSVYDEAKFRHSRQLAFRLLGRLGERLVRAEFVRHAKGIFARWRSRSEHILGVHARGSDKIVRRKVPPEAYFPLVDAYVEAHPDALVFLATEDRSYHERFAARYKGSSPNRSRLLSLTSGYENFDSRYSSHVGRKGDDVLIDALILAQCDFLLKAASAVAEFAIWVRPALHEKHLDLQMTDAFASQTLPSWLASRGRAAVSREFCASLARGCDLEDFRKGPKYCSRCAKEVFH